jgi:hypothetical protein
MPFIQRHAMTKQDLDNPARKNMGAMAQAAGSPSDWFWNHMHYLSAT